MWELQYKKYYSIKKKKVNFIIGRPLRKNKSHENVSPFKELEMLKKETQKLKLGPMDLNTED